MAGDKTGGAAEPSLSVDDSVVARVAELRGQRGVDGLMLRVSVEGGGCAGFQYRMVLEEAVEARDRVFGGCVLVDPVSLGFLVGARVVFEKTLKGAEFRIDNPNAASGCGCGISFSV